MMLLLLKLIKMKNKKMMMMMFNKIHQIMKCNNNYKMKMNRSLKKSLKIHKR